LLPAGRSVDARALFVDRDTFVDVPPNQKFEVMLTSRHFATTTTLTQRRPDPFSACFFSYRVDRKVLTSSETIPVGLSHHPRVDFVPPARGCSAWALDYGQAFSRWSTLHQETPWSTPVDVFQNVFVAFSHELCDIPSRRCFIEPGSVRSEREALLRSPRFAPGPL